MIWIKLVTLTAFFPIDGFYDDSCNNDRKKKRETDDFESLFGDLAEEEEYTELG